MHAHQPFLNLKGEFRDLKVGDFQHEEFLMGHLQQRTDFYPSPKYIGTEGTFLKTRKFSFYHNVF